jgi:hypothetical protein
MSHTTASRHAATMRTVRDSMMVATAILVIIGASARR